MSKENFKNPKARYTGEELFKQDKELATVMNQNADRAYEELPKTHSLTMLGSYIDKMRDYVHYQKLNGHPYYTQGQLLQEALDQFFQNLGIDIPERPDHVKRSEKRRTGRRKKSTGSNKDFDDLGFNS
ncbi:MAG: hypothetical protein NXI20_16745 [bacterium]|nr:hypothetical protein [bacterium]